MPSFDETTKVGHHHVSQQLQDAQNLLNRNQEVRNLRLATGKRINSAEDDSAGYVIARGFKARNQSLAVALNNIGDARSALSIAESGATNILDLLETIKQKATQASNGLLNDEQRLALSSEVEALVEEIDDIAHETSFNNIDLLTGTELNIQSGADPGDTDSVEVSVVSHDAESLGVADIDVSSVAGAAAALKDVDSAIATVVNGVAAIGSSQARLSEKLTNIEDSITDSEAARSRIMDADIAAERLEATKLQLQQDSSSAVSAQANATSASVLSLI